MILHAVLRALHERSIMSPAEFQVLARSWKELGTQLNLAIYLRGTKHCSIRVQISGQVTIARAELFCVNDDVNSMQIDLKGCKYSFLHPKEELPDFVNPVRIECPDGEICLILTDQPIN